MLQGFLLRLGSSLSLIVTGSDYKGLVKDKDVFLPLTRQIHQTFIHQIKLVLQGAKLVVMVQTAEYLPSL